MRPTPSAPLPSLRRELLVNLGVLVAAALTLAIGTALLVGLMRPGLAAVALVALVAGDVAVVFVFGRHLLNRLVLHPMAELTAAADQLTAGNLARRAPPAETQDFNALAARFNAMTDQLLDAQSQLVRTEKLATVGRFAAGVAHEVGNPLSAIGTYLEVLKKAGADPEVVGAASRETARIDRILRGLLEYARPRDERTGAVDLAQLVRGVHELLERQGVLRGATVTLACEPDLPLVRGTAHALEQVVVNLLLNAVDAAKDGKIVVGAVSWRYRAPEPERRRSDPSLHQPEASRQPPDPSTRRPWRPELAPGTSGALLYVADSGPGISREDRERVFEPFFTTKPPGLGIGLGLAVVQRSVHACGGLVWVEDAREGGAAFKIFLPAASP